MESVSDNLYDWIILLELFLSSNSEKIKVKVALEQATKAQRRSRGMSVLFF